MTLAHVLPEPSLPARIAALRAELADAEAQAMGARRVLVLDATIPVLPETWKHNLPTGQNPKGYEDYLRQITPHLESAWLLPPAMGSLRRRRPPEVPKGGWNEPLAMELAFYFRRPAERPSYIPEWMWALPECDAVAIRTEDKNGRSAYCRADLDNLVAAVQDAITRIGIWFDDSLVTRMPGEPRKVYLPAGRTDEHTTVRVWRWVPLEGAP